MSLDIWNHDTVFWNVDTQYDFMRDDEGFKGALAVKGARAIERNLETLTSIAREHGYRVINTADWHTPESKEFSANPDYKSTFPPHCLQGTKGASYVPATTPENPVTIDWQAKSFDPDAVRQARNIVLYKDAFDVFSGTPHTDAVLDIVQPKRAVVYGVATNVCVDFAVKGLLERGIEVTVVRDAIKELPGLDLDKTLDTWRELGAKFAYVKADRAKHPFARSIKNVLNIPWPSSVHHYEPWFLRTHRWLTGN